MPIRSQTQHLHETVTPGTRCPLATPANGWECASPPLLPADQRHEPDSSHPLHQRRNPPDARRGRHRRPVLRGDRCDQLCAQQRCLARLGQGRHGQCRAPGGAAHCQRHGCRFHLPPDRRQQHVGAASPKRPGPQDLQRHPAARIAPAPELDRDGHHVGARDVRRQGPSLCQRRGPRPQRPLHGVLGMAGRQTGARAAARLRRPRHRRLVSQGAPATPPHRGRTLSL